MAGVKHKSEVVGIQKAEIEKPWPTIRAANIEAE